MALKKTNEYVEKLTILIESLKPKRPRGTSIEVKPFFGGAAAYANGKICISLTKVGLALKLPSEKRSELLDSGKAKELQYFPAAPVKKQYALLKKKSLDDSELLKLWMGISIAFALSN